MSYDKPEVLFWVFTGFFILIGLMSAAAIVGWIKVPDEFKKLAIGSFAASVVSVVVVWAQIPQVDFLVNLDVPSDVSAATFVIEKGRWRYYEQSNTEPPPVRSGSVEVTAGQSPGTTTAKLPAQTAGKGITLELDDSTGNKWVTPPFYPNVVNQAKLRKHARVAGEDLAPADKPAIALRSLDPISSSFAADSSSMQDFMIESCATAFSKKGAVTYYQWRILVDEQKEKPRQIKNVEYLLPQSFAQPVVALGEKSAANKFAFQASGRESFPIQVTVAKQDGTQMTTRHRLDVTKKCPEASKLSGKRFLWVDDNPENNTSVRNALEESGVTFVLAKSTSEAIEKIQGFGAKPFDVIISDYNRADEKEAGFVLLRKLATTTSPPPVVLYTGSASEELEKQAKKLKAVGLTNRPDRLLELILEAVKTP